MNACRKEMMEKGGNLGWCAPFTSVDGTCEFVVNEDKIVSVRIDGEDYHGSDVEKILPKLAKRVGAESCETFDIVMSSTYEHTDCCYCPWFEGCDAMDIERVAF